LDYFPFMDQKIRLYFLIVLMAATSTVNMALARPKTKTIEGPVEAELIRVIDGDTLLVNAKPWPQQIMEVYVRIRGIDAPEIHAKCDSTRQAGERAMQQLQALAGRSAQLRLVNISGDKYFGRVLADVLLGDGTDTAQFLLKEKLVSPYHGGKKSKTFCPSLF
jgi:micrococcal nuclease